MTKFGQIGAMGTESPGRSIRWHTIKDQPSSVVGDVGEQPFVAKQNSDLRLYIRRLLRQSRRSAASKAGVDLSTGVE